MTMDPGASSAAQPRARPKTRVRALLVLAALVLAGAAAVLSMRGPSPVAATAPPSEFSSARAMKHVTAIAQQPRRAGSAAHEAARAYIVHELEALGLSVETQSATVLQERYSNPAYGSPARIADVKNIVTRMPGAHDPAPGALLLMAHYDTVSMSPGASDDGAGVATLLETARALSAGGPIAVNDVIFLFSDGEEEGLLGAKAFVDEHPWASQVRVVLNFDARGDAGPVMMFQSTDENGGLLRELGAAVSHPFASSVAREAYRRLPNDTDLTEWLPTRAQGMNFANIDRLDRYHTSTDTPENLDPRTLQQQGTYALGLARDLARANLDAPREHDATYFDAGPFFVRYPQRFASLVCGLALFSSALFIVVAIRKRAVRVGSIGIALGAALLPVVIAGLAAFGLWALTERAHPEYGSLSVATPTIERLYACGFIALAFAIVSIVYVLVSRRVRLADLAAATALAWSCAAMASTVYVPSVAYLFAWPLLVATAAWTIGTWLAKDGLDDARAPSVLLHLASAIAIVVFFAPAASELLVAFGPAAAPALAVLLALALGLMLPSLFFILAEGRGLAPLLALGGAVLLMLVAHLTPLFDREDPRPDTLFFAVDQDAKKSYWVTTDPALDEWTGKRMAGAIRAPLPALLPMAPSAPLLHREVVPWIDERAAEVTVVSDDRAAPSGALRLRVVPPPGAEFATVLVGAASRARGAVVQGKSVQPMPKGSLAFEYTAPPSDGFELDLDARGAVSLRVVVQTRGVPELPSLALRPRPPELMPRPQTLPPYDELEDSDMTIVSKSFAF